MRLEVKESHPRISCIWWFEVCKCGLIFWIIRPALFCSFWSLSACLKKKNIYQHPILYQHNHEYPPPPPPPRWARCSGLARGLTHLIYNFYIWNTNHEKKKFNITLGMTIIISPFLMGYTFFTKSFWDTYPILTPHISQWRWGLRNDRVIVYNKNGQLTNGIRCIKLKQRWKDIRLKRVIDWRTSDQWDTLYQIKTKMKGHKIKTCDWLTDFWPMGYAVSN